MAEHLPTVTESLGLDGPQESNVGRPKAKFDLGEVEKLASYHCEDQEIAAFFDVDPKTVQRRKKDDPAFLSAIEKGRDKGKLSLRRWQFDAAKTGNITMLIWLGKQYLGQADKADWMKDGKPFEFTIAINGEDDHLDGELD